MSDSTQDPVKWIQTDKFVMPVIPDELGVDPRTLALLHCISFLELSGDATVEPDWAVEAMEHVAHYLQRLDDDGLTRIRTDMASIALWAESKQMPRRFIELARRFTANAGLELEE